MKLAIISFLAVSCADAGILRSVAYPFQHPKYSAGRVVYGIAQPIVNPATCCWRFKLKVGKCLKATGRGFVRVIW